MVRNLLQKSVKVIGHKFNDNSHLKQSKSGKITNFLKLQDSGNLQSVSPFFQHRNIFLKERCFGQLNHSGLVSSTCILGWQELKDNTHESCCPSFFFFLCWGWEVLDSNPGPHV